MSKYIVKNCPAMGAGCCGDTCPEITDCPLKQIVELCKKTVKIFSAESGTHPYAGGRCIEAEGILQLLDIQEVE